MRWIAAVLALAVLGCASADLVVTEADTPEEERRKTAARVGLGLATLGLSEIPLGMARREADAARKEEARAAWKWSLDEAHTMGEIARLFGSAPDSCFSSSTESQICTWNLGRRRGETGMYPIDQVYRREVGWQVSAVCELPKDGSPRELDSCQLSVE